MTTSIGEIIEAEGGLVTFAHFMRLALTHPTLGYYSRARCPLGAMGDFNTAPILSPFFNRTVSRLVTELLDGAVATLPQNTPLRIIELGGGEGQLAQAILASWEAERPHLRERVSYRIVEIGTRLRWQQERILAAARAAKWDVGWASTLAEACDHTGSGVSTETLWSAPSPVLSRRAAPVVIVGNEFLDTMPVHLLHVHTDMLEELHVTVESGELQPVWAEVSPAAKDELELLFATADPVLLQSLTEDGIIEVSPKLGDFMQELASLMPMGSFVTIDYGDWYRRVVTTGEAAPQPGCEARAKIQSNAHPEPPRAGDSALRSRTVRGYFKHQLVTDPLARPGAQDLTANVDFAALDLHGQRAGFETVLFTTLASFLRGGGAATELEALVGKTPAAQADLLEADRQHTVLQNLVDETDLGSAFKVMVQVRG